MGLRSFFQRKPAPGSSPTPSPADETQGQFLSPEDLADLEAAWADLAAAAEASEMTNFRACTRTGKSWTGDPAAVRAAATTLREFPALEDRPPQ
jgi:hypothetical protein